MIVLAVLLLVLVTAFVVFVVVAGTGESVLMTWEALNLRWEPTALLVFLAGALTVVALGAALALLRSGARRSSDKRRELKRLRRAEQEGALAPSGERAGTRPAADRGTTPPRDPARGTPDASAEDRPHDGGRRDDRGSTRA